MLLMTHNLLQSSAAEVNSEMYQPGNCLATGESKLSDCAFKCNLFGKSHVWFRLSCCASECHLWRRFPNTLQYLIIHRLMVIHIKWRLFYQHILKLSSIKRNELTRTKVFLLLILHYRVSNSIFFHEALIWNSWLLWVNLYCIYTKLPFELRGINTFYTWRIPYIRGYINKNLIFVIFLCTRNLNEISRDFSLLKPALLHH